MDRLPTRSAVAAMEPPATAVLVYEVDPGKPIYGYLLPLDSEILCNGMCDLPELETNRAVVIWDAGMDSAWECSDCLKDSIVEFYDTECLL